MTQKTCCKCKLPKDIECFSIKRSSKDGKAKECKSCKRLYNQSLYKKHTQRERTRLKKRTNELRDWYKELKRNKCCSRCPENHPACIEFHHLDPKQKAFEISTCWRKGYSIQRIEEEIAKCIILCSNCHRKEHS